MGRTANKIVVVRRWKTIHGGTDIHIHFIAHSEIDNEMARGSRHLDHDMGVETIRRLNSDMLIEREISKRFDRERSRRHEPRINRLLTVPR